jgi:hypothetical protein
MVANDGRYRSHSSRQDGGRSRRGSGRRRRYRTNSSDSLHEVEEDDSAKLLRCLAWRGEAQNGGDASATARPGLAFVAERNGEGEEE